MDTGLLIIGAIFILLIIFAIKAKAARKREHLQLQKIADFMDFLDYCEANQDQMGPGIRKAFYKYAKTLRG